MSFFFFIQTNALLKLVCLYFVQNPWRGILKMIANNNTNSKSTYKIITVINNAFSNTVELFSDTLEGFLSCWPIYFKQFTVSMDYSSIF